MAEVPDESPESPESPERRNTLLEELADAGPSPDRRMFALFAVVLGAAIAGALWLALRSRTPESMHAGMDFVLQLSLGALLAYAGFRALALFPFRFFDLLSIVVVLPFLLKIIIEALERIAASPLFPLLGIKYEVSYIGITVQICSMAASIFLAGAALGLRHCHILKIENPFKRVAAVLSGMLALPAAAGVIVFPMLLLGEVLIYTGPQPETGEFLAWWLLSIVATVVNAVYLIRTMTLTHIIDARSH